ncbi:hypothetical protein GALMADRAFT_147428 [Galerina marginata CBS 339.88]|uniref:Uncharacterized protein n=1 Tax=Galerina marginata (strain CBS 339.88) TaxID=685588 RepID=A0A067SAM1_GALM3|nr:hypothetical protein GALMADRAFT_147428 [Galerina marginata CBS 339.88]
MAGRGRGREPGPAHRDGDAILPIPPRPAPLPLRLREGGLDGLDGLGGGEAQAGWGKRTMLVWRLASAHPGPPTFSSPGPPYPIPSRPTSSAAAACLSSRPAPVAHVGHDAIQNSPSTASRVYAPRPRSRPTRSGARASSCYCSDGFLQHLQLQQRPELPPRLALFVTDEDLKVLGASGAGSKLLTSDFPRTTLIKLSTLTLSRSSSITAVDGFGSNPKTSFDFEFNRPP